MRAAFNNPQRAVEYLMDPSSMPAQDAAPLAANPAAAVPANPAADIPANPGAAIPENPAATAAGGAGGVPPELAVRHFSMLVLLLFLD